MLTLRTNRHQLMTVTTTVHCLIRINGRQWSTSNYTRKKIQLQISDITKEAVSSARNYYNNITGMPLIVAAQEEVFEIKNKLQDIQNQRRPLMLDMQRTREEILKVTHELQIAKKTEPIYLEIVKRNIELLQRERADQERLKLLDDEERDTFTELTMALRRSHELEGNQSAHLKYFSWIFSLVCGGLSMFAFLLKYLNTSAEHKEVKSMMGNSYEHLASGLQAITMKLNEMEKAMVANKNQSETKVNNSDNSAGAWLWWACKPVVNGIKYCKFW